MKLDDASLMHGEVAAGQAVGTITSATRSTFSGEI